MLLEILLLLLGLMALPPDAASASASTSTPRPPNFIFLLADDWGWGDSYFNVKSDPVAPPHTPNLDKMASRGVVFSDFHTASPVCSPSRAGFMTGNDPSRFRIHTALNVHWDQNAAQDQANYLETNVPTVTRLLQQAGWTTGHFGKWHLGSGANASNASQSAPLPTEYGIDRSCTFNSNDPCQANAQDFNTSIDIVDHAMEFISDTAAQRKPFYVNIWLHVSHDRLDPTAAQKAAESSVCQQRGLATNQTVCPQQVFVAAQRDADVQVGRLYKLLGDLDLHESTLLLFSTDNGPEEQQVYANARGSTGPFRGRKRSLYEGGTRVPSFALWGGGTPKPTIPPGGVDHTVLSANDWLPTVLSIARVPLPADLALDGEDMSAVFLRNATGQRAPTARTKPVFWEWRYGIAGTCDNVSPHYAVRDGAWKYLVNADGSRRELYRLDLYNGNASYNPDFNERVNVAAAHASQVAKMAHALAGWRATIPPCASFVPDTSCSQFTSQVFPGGGGGGGGAAAVRQETEPQRWEDSDPDWWFDPASNKHVFWSMVNSEQRPSRRRL